MPTTSKRTKRLTIIAIACAGPLWGCAGITGTNTRTPTGDVGNARVETIWGTDDDAALAAVAGAGAGLTTGLIYDQRSERSAYRDGYAAGRQAQPPPPPPIPEPLAPPGPSLAPLAVPPAPGW